MRTNRGKLSETRERDSREREGARCNKECVRERDKRERERKPRVLRFEHKNDSLY